MECGARLTGRLVRLPSEANTPGKEGDSCASIRLACSCAMGQS